MTRRIAAALLFAVFALPAHAAGSASAAAHPPPGAQLVRLAWQRLVLHFAYPQNNIELVVRLDRQLDPRTGPRLESIVVSVGEQSYVVHDQSLQQIKLTDLGDMWTSYYVAGDGTKYVSLYIPEIGGMLAEIDILGMKQHRINVHPL